MGELLGGFDYQEVIDAETAVIGSCLIDPDSIVKVRNVIGAPQESVFHIRDNRVIWSAMASLWDSGESVDPVSVSWRIKDQGHDGITPVELHGLADRTYSSMHAETYARQVLDAYRGRRVEQIAQGLVGQLHDGKNVDAIMEWASMEILGNRAIEDKPETMSDLVADLRRQLTEVRRAKNDGVMVGVPTSIPDLDKILGGLRGGDLCLYAARPGMGKTTAALQTAAEFCKMGGTVFFYSLEMGSEQLNQKLLSSLTGVPYDRIRAGDWDDTEQGIIDAALITMAEWNMVIRDDLHTVEEIRDHALTLGLKGLTPGLVVVDYIQLASTSKNFRGNKVLEVSEISRTLKLLARDLNRPLIALSQLSRSVEQRADKRPLLSDLRESGGLEQDADQVVFLYRDGYYKEDSESPFVLDFIARKNRHGDTGTVSTFFSMEYGRIRPLERTRTDLDY